MRRNLSILALLLAVAVLGLGLYAEYAASQERERVLEPGFVLSVAFITSLVLALASFLAWPRRRN